MGLIVQAGANPLALATTTTAANGSGASFDFKDARQAALMLVVTSAIGSAPKLDVTVEESVDGSAWVSLATFAQATDAGFELITVSAFARFLRCSWVITGPASVFGFRVDATAKN